MTYAVDGDGAEVLHLGEYISVEVDVSAALLQDLFEVGEGELVAILVAAVLG